MSNPSFSNIDRWLFELMEGNLSPEQVAQLESFLIHHPELDVDKDMWELAKVDSQEMVYPNQEKLFRRKPVGLYMSLGFASIALIISIGVLTNQNSTVQGGNFAARGESIELSAQNKPFSSLSYKLKSNNKSIFDANEIEVGQKDVNTHFATNQFLGNTEKSFNGNVQYYSTNTSEIIPTYFNNSASSEVLITESGNSNINNGSLGQVPINAILTEKAKQIEPRSQEKEMVYRTSSFYGGSKYGGSDYKISFHSKLNKFGRSLQRMLDNPVALKNKKDPYYHVPGMQAMDINFGSVGTMLATRVQTVTRAQWLGEENQQFTNQLSIDGYSYGIRGGIGFQFNHNYYGDGGIENYNAAMTYSPKFSVSRNVNIEPSIRFKMGSKVLNSDQIESGSTVEFDRGITQSFYSNGSAPIGSNLWYKDLGLGLMVNTKWFFVGVQGDNLLEHYDNIYSNDISNPRRAGKHFVATIGTDYDSKKENLTVSPYFVYQQRESFSEGWLGVNLRFRWLTLGGAISSNFEPAASIGLKFDHFMLTYNADYTRSEMLNKNPLSHQITIRFISKPSRTGQRLLNQ